MAENVELELKLKGGDKAVKTLGKLEQELNDAREAIKKVEVGSDAFNKLATQIQKASSEVKTLEKQMEGLEPQQKAEAFLKLGEGIAGGFAVGQGAMALMGVESENLEKIQVKVQAAISIAMGVRMMSEAALMATTAKRVIVEKLSNAQTAIGSVVQKGNTVATIAAAGAQKILAFAIGTSSTALKVLKFAIMATGIGALVVGVVALVSAMGSWFSSSKDTAGAQRDLAAEADAVKEAIKEQLEERRRLSDHERNVRNEQDLNKKTLLELNEQLRLQKEETNNNNRVLASLEGTMTQYNMTLDDFNDGTKNSILDIRERNKELEQQEEEIKDLIDAQNELIASEAKAEREKRERENRRKARAQKRKNEAKELLSLEQELSLMRIEDENNREQAKIELDRQNALTKAEIAGNSREQILLINEKFDILEAERKQKVADEEYDAFIENSNKFNEQYEANAEKQKEIDQKAKDDKTALDQAVFDARRDMQANAFSAGAALFEKNKTMSKAIAVSQTIFSTQQAIVDALAAKGTDALLPYPIRLGNAISAGVIGAASVRNILSENMGADVSAGVGGGGGTPDAMIPSTTGAFTLGGALPDQEPVKAYVVTDEMSDSQSQLSDIRRRSTI